MRALPNPPLSQSPLAPGIQCLDAELLALAPALESAVREREAFDRDLASGSGDPDSDEIYARRKALTLAADEAAQRILAHRPKTPAGLLLVAHAAAAEGDYLWDPAETDLDSAERGLRAVCDGLFTLVGVDWRGRPLAGAAAAPQPMASPDPIFGMIEVSRIALDAHAAALAAPDAMTPAGWARTAPAARAAREAWTALLTVTPTTAAGITALARHATDQAARGDGLEADDLLALLGTIGAAKPGADNGSATDEAPDPVLAVIEASRIALAEHVAASNAPNADTPTGDARRTRASDTNCRIWTTLLATPPRTVAGALVLARYLPAFIKDGPWDDTTDAATLFRAIGAVEPGPSTVMPPSEGSEVSDPVFAAAAAYREAHVAMLAAQGPNDDVLNLAQRRRDAAFEALLRTRPTTWAGRLAYASQAVFELAQSVVIGAVPVRWAREANLMLNGGPPLAIESLPPAVTVPSTLLAAE